MPNTFEIRPLDLNAIWKDGPPAMDFVLPGLLVGTVGNIVAAGGTGKSYLMMATALGIAIGRDLGEIWGRKPTQGRAVFLSLEDPEVVLRARLHALLSLLSPEERRVAAANFEVLSCAGERISLAEPTSEAVVASWSRTFKEFLARVPSARLCVIDTLNRALGGISENDASAMGALIGEIERLARDARCAIVLAHHVSKQALSTTGPSEAHAARGSSVITDNARWQSNAWVPSAKESGFEEMSEVERQAFVCLSVTKTNYEPPIAPRLLHRSSVGVLSHFGERPEPTSQIAKSTARRKQAGAEVASEVTPPTPTARRPDTNQLKHAMKRRAPKTSAPASDLYARLKSA